MTEKKTKSQDIDETFTKLTSDSLVGKQSIRTSFKLPARVIELLRIAASQLGLKQKSIFDHLAVDRKILGQIAGESQNYESKSQDRFQKTYVISKDSLDALSEIAMEYGISRDVLVEISIKRLIPVINDEQEKQQSRKNILKNMETYLKQGKKILKKSIKLLGKDDHTTIHIAHLINLCDKSMNELTEVVEKGRQVEDFV